MEDNISGFFSQNEGYGKPELDTFIQIPTPDASVCDLYRGERAGKFRVYKCLKPQYRGSLLHEGLLKKEFESGYSLKHNNLCEIYSFMEIEGLGNCIEMEWIDGVTLDEYLKHNKLSEASFRRLASQLCDALICLHSHQIIHRDLKPSNIMICQGGEIVKLIDFGLADSNAYTVFKSPAGTRRWAAPEVLNGQMADVRSDIFSLGAVLRQMTSSHCRCIAKCMRENPELRYSSVSEVKNALIKKRNVWPVVATAVIALLMVAATIIVALTRAINRESDVKSVVDTIYVKPPIEESQSVNPQPEAARSAAKQDRPASETQPQTTKDDIDEMFEQASDLFEENL